MRGLQAAAAGVRQAVVPARARRLSGHTAAARRAERTPGGGCAAARRGRHPAGPSVRAHTSATLTGGDHRGRQPGDGEGGRQNRPGHTPRCTHSNADDAARHEELDDDDSDAEDNIERTWSCWPRRWRWSSAPRAQEEARRAARVQGTPAGRRRRGGRSIAAGCARGSPRWWRWTRRSSRRLFDSSSMSTKSSCQCMSTNEYCIE